MDRSARGARVDSWHKTGALPWADRTSRWDNERPACGRTERLCATVSIDHRLRSWRQQSTPTATRWQCPANRQCTPTARTGTPLHSRRTKWNQLIIRFSRVNLYSKLTGGPFIHKTHSFHTRRFPKTDEFTDAHLVENLRLYIFVCFFCEHP